jgi:hypothetical protein
MPATVRVPKDFQKAYDAARDQNWRIEFSAKHIKWVPPVGQIIFTAKTPSDVRAVRNEIARLKRSGLVIS